MKQSLELPILSFKTLSTWTDWLAEHHAFSQGVWLKLARKKTNIQSITYDEALESALCFGWIDGQKRSFDDSFWLQKFTPRRPKSIWSKINRRKAEELIKAGRMQPAGLEAIEAARLDGRWDAAYDSQATGSVPEDFQVQLDRHPKARAFFATLNSANRYAILFRLQTAKRPATRLKRIQEFIAMLERKEVFHR